MVKDWSSKIPGLKDLNIESKSDPETTVIASGCTLKGELATDGDVRVNGNVEGQVFSKGKVFVAENSLLKGDIRCSEVDLHGSVDGNVTADDMLLLKSTSCVIGDIYTRKLQVELGAQLNGACHMHKEGLTATDVE